MSEVGVAFVSIVPSARGFGRNLEGQISGEAAAAGAASGKKFGGTFASSSTSAIKAVGLVGLFDVAVRAITGSVTAARDAQKVAATTEAVIRATGGAAKVTSKDVEGLATAISKKTAIDDDSIRTGSNLILTFKNVRNEVGEGNKIFDQATQAAVDLSAAGFGSIESASVMLGKALNDPVKGMTALQRAGVTFTQTQRDQVKALQEAGDLLGAQKIILKEVQEQVGGTAEAQATNIDKLRTALGELGEAAGGDLNVKLEGIANNILKLAPAIERVQTATGGKPLLGDLFSDITVPLNPLNAAMDLLATDTEKLKADVSADWSAIKNSISTNVGNASSAIRSKFGEIVAAAKALPGQVKTAVGNLGNSLLTAGGQLVTGLINGIKAKAKAAVDAAKGVVGDAIAAAKRLLRIGSPSKVFHEIGAFTTLGFAEGIDSKRSTAMASVTSLMQGVSATSSNLSSRTAFHGGSASSSAPIQQTILPQPGQSEVEIGRAAANRLLFAMAAG